MCSVLCFFQVKLCSSANNFFLECNILLKYLFQREYLRYSVVKRQHNCTECYLHIGHFVEIVQHNLCVCVPLYCDLNVHTFSVGVVLHICYTLETLFFYQVGDTLNESRLVYAIWNFGYYYLKSVTLCFDYFCSCTDINLASACCIGFFYSLCTHYYTCCRKIGTFYVFHYFVQLGIWVVYQTAHSLYYLSHIVRRNVCCHTYCDTR